MPKTLLKSQGKLNKFNWANCIVCLWAILITYSAVSYTYKHKPQQTFNCYGERHVITENFE